MIPRAVGVDLGKQNDFTAITVADLVPGPGDRNEVHVVHIRRIRRASYTTIADELVGMAQWPALQGCPFVVDGTGVGVAVFDLLRERLPLVEAISITSGLQVTEPVPRQRNVPKADLVAVLEVLVASHRLVVARELPDAQALMDELVEFGYSISEAGRKQFGGRGAHDDLVLSLALAAWRLMHQGPGGAFLEYMKRRITPFGMPPTLAPAHLS